MDLTFPPEVVALAARVTEYARTREAFGQRLGHHGGVSFMLADNLVDIHTTRLAIQHCFTVGRSVVGSCKRRPGSKGKGRAYARRLNRHARV